MDARTKTWRRGAITLSLVLGGMAFPAAAAAGPSCGNPAIPAVDGPYPVVKEDVSVRTRDGEELKAWVFKPATTPPPGGWPMILHLHGGAAMANDPRTDVVPLETQDAYACRGYVVVSYLRRGYPGIVTTNPTLNVNPSSNRATTTGWDWGGPIDVGDGEDVISWAIANEPVDAQHIGASGGSQAAFVVYALAGSDSRIQTIIPTAGYDSWNNHAVRNGTVGPGCAAYPAFGLGLLTTSTVENMVEYCKLTLSGMAGLGNDNAYWWERSPARWAPGLTIPVFNAIDTLDPNWNPSGWIRMHRMLPGTHNKLFVGPVPIHVDLPVPQRQRFQTDVQRWWDQWLKGADTGITSDPPITWAAPPDNFFSPTDPWTIGTSLQLPPCGAAPVTYSLSQGGALVTGPGAGMPEVLVNDPAAGAANDLLLGTTVVQTPVDTVAFRSTPVAADTILTGDIHLDLSLTSLSPRYQVNPDFYDVSPDGTAKRIYWLPSVSIGPIIPFAVMDGVPGQDRHLSWDPETTFFVVRAGHRIELRISTAQREGLLPEPAPGGYFVNHAGAKQSTLTFSALPLAQLDWSNHNCPAS